MHTRLIPWGPEAEDKTRTSAPHLRTWVMVWQMWTWAARPTTETRTRCCRAAPIASRMLPGSHVDSALSSTSACAPDQAGKSGD